MSRIVVIGAGVGGLAVAARLAVKGHDVRIVEQAERVGGKLHTHRRDGFAFDTGPSLFTLPAVYRDLFLKTGASLEDSVDLQAVEPGFGYRFADGTQAVLPGVGIGAAAGALGDALGGNARAEWLTLMKRASDMWKLTRAPVLQSPLEGWRSAARLTRSISDVRTIAPFTSLHRLGNATFSDARLVTLLDRYATYTGSDPRRAPAALATIPFVEQTFGAWHIGGGIGTLAGVLADRARERGVQIDLRTTVSGITTAHGAVTGVELASGDAIPADIVVSDVDATSLYRSLLHAPASTGSVTRTLARQTPSLGGFVMLLAVRGRTPGIQHHNVWFPADYSAEFTAIFGRHPAPVDDPAIYACVPDDPRMRPDDQHESWFILVNAPRHSATGSPGTIDWDTPGRGLAYASHVLDRLAARGTDLRQRIVFQEVATPADLERDIQAPGGAIYGAASHGSMSTFRRPRNQSPVEGLFLVGGSAHPGGGLPLVGMGAELVAELIGRARPAR
ncbi:MAG: phytoene desaturase family protein [Candidatus Nanopelagicales bacterium]|nr:phytoene desaturase family protein [Candidatus Nanopelagicales bacterium]